MRQRSEHTEDSLLGRPHSDESQHRRQTVPSGHTLHSGPIQLRAQDRVPAVASVHQVPPTTDTAHFGETIEEDPGLHLPEQTQIDHTLLPEDQSAEVILLGTAVQTDLLHRQTRDREDQPDPEETTHHPAVEHPAELLLLQEQTEWQAGLIPL